MLDPIDRGDGILTIAEGLETAITGRQLGIGRSWALGSAGAIERFPVLPGVRLLRIHLENDESGTNARAVDKCEGRWVDAGKNVSFVKPVRGNDLNDAWRSGNLALIPMPKVIHLAQRLVIRSEDAMDLYKSVTADQIKSMPPDEWDAYGKGADVYNAFMAGKGRAETSGITGGAVLPEQNWRAYTTASERKTKGNGPDKTTSAAKTLPEGVNLEDFYAYMEMHSYIFAPSRGMWPAASVNGRFPPIQVGKGKPIPASRWLDKNRPVEQMTWAPGEPILIRNRLISDGGWIERQGVTCFNLYRAPIAEKGNQYDVDPWLEHISGIYPEDAAHIINWLAHRVQRPQEKINHALVLGGCQGIGKDTLLEPAKRAIGHWNFIEVSPKQMLGRFNEASDLGDVSRYEFYDHLKAYTAAPPGVLRCDEKNLREHYVLNCCGVIITSNHKADGIYLPADDRRHFVAWSNATKEEFAPAY